MAEKLQRSEEVEGAAERRERIEGILSSMQVKLKEIDSLRRELGREQSSSISARQSLQMLEEIKVPSIEALREERKRR